MIEEELQKPFGKLQEDIDGIQEDIRAQKGIISFVPGGVNWKLVSERSIDPGHHHTSKSLDIEGIDNLFKIPQITRLASDFSKNNTTLQTIPGLESNGELQAGEYLFRTKLYITANTTGGIKVSVDGTANPEIIYDVLIYGDGVLQVKSKAANYGSTFTNTGKTAYEVDIVGTLKITTGNEGTLQMLFAQATASGTSTVLKGSFFELTQIS